MDLPSTGVFDPATRPERIRAIVFGATGYIGRAVVRQFLEQGYSVTAFVRAKSGVSGRDGVEELRGLFPGAQVVVGDVTKRETIGGAFEGLGSGASVVVSCLASRSGGIEDSNRVDYEATLNVLETAWERGVKHFVLLSAVCVQKPELEFQRAKLKFEAELAGLAEREPEFSYAVVRPTAFFKSLAGQVERVKKGAAFVMFGDGDLCRCNAISERDLARFIVECGRDEGKRNQVLAVGGPGKAVTPREQGEMLFRVLGKEEKFMRVPIAVMDVAVGVLGGLAKVFPGLRDVAEFGKIGRYYAVEDMVAPGWGEDGLEEFFREAVKEGGMEGQDLGAAKVF
eukprot:GFKZ01002826.1.p1 GENE.GFKZ01002826.1~~GFKZ01002826.1.p1  ORF type:complete len:367 (-),score=69.76 GFKZ01002826.1:630-1649(-)